jgi:hypothetical protein
MIANPQPQPSPVVVKPLPSPIRTTKVALVGLGQHRAQAIDRYVDQHRTDRRGSSLLTPHSSLR